MSKAVILQHVPYAGPGRIIPLFRDYGIPTEVRHLYKGDEVPTELDELRVLVVLGGPIGVADVGSEKFPFLAQEVELLRRLIAADRSVLGIALGAQLLAHAAGAKVYPNARPGSTPQDPTTPMAEPTPEFGWHPVTFPFPGGTEPMVFGMIDGAPMFHWRRDTLDLPRLPPPPNAPPPPAPPPPTGNALLSSSKLTRNQAFRFKTRLFGFQYHLELTPPDIEAIVAADRESVQQVLGADGERRIREDTRKYYSRYARLGDRILANFVQFLRVY